MCFGGNTTQTQSSSSPPASVQDAIDNLLARGDSVARLPYQTPPSPDQRVAPFNADQSAAFDTIRGLQGGYQPALDQAGQLATRGTTPLAGTLGTFDDAALQKYSSPYTQGVIDSVNKDFDRQGAISSQDVRARAAQAGAFGGDRATIAETEGQRNLDDARFRTISGLRQNDFQQAQAQFNQEQGRGLAARESDASNSFQGANVLSNLATQGQSLGLQGAGSQLAAGSTQQQRQQSLADVGYQNFIDQRDYPKNQAAFLSSIVHGYAPGSTGTNTVPGPSTASQLAGLGIAGVGAAGVAQKAGLFSGAGQVGTTIGGSGIPAGGFAGATGIAAADTGSDFATALGGMTNFARGGMARRYDEGGYVDRLDSTGGYDEAPYWARHEDGVEGVYAPSREEADPSGIAGARDIGYRGDSSEGYPRAQSFPYFAQNPSMELRQNEEQPAGLVGSQFPYRDETAAPARDGYNTVPVKRGLMDVPGRPMPPPGADPANAYPNTTLGQDIGAGLSAIGSVLSPGAVAQSPEEEAAMRRVPVNQVVQERLERAAAQAGRAFPASDAPVGIAPASDAPAGVAGSSVAPAAAPGIAPASDAPNTTPPPLDRGGAYSQSPAGVAAAAEPAAPPPPNVVRGPSRQLTPATLKTNPSTSTTGGTIAPVKNGDQVVQAPPAGQGASLPVTKAAAQAAEKTSIPDWAIPVMQAGFAIMGGTSPFALTNIGQGAVAGLNAYQKQRQVDATNQLKTMEEKRKLSHDAMTNTVALAGLQEKIREADMRSQDRSLSIEQRREAVQDREEGRRQWREMQVQFHQQSAEAAADRSAGRPSPEERESKAQDLRDQHAATGETTFRKTLMDPITGDFRDPVKGPQQLDDFILRSHPKSTQADAIRESRAQQAVAAVPPAAVEFLKANPSQRAAFEAKYGKGLAARVLGE